MSIITVGPGANLYDCFGHSAFRIKDPSKGLDRAYNYGQFDFSEGGFVGKFTMGIAQYRLGGLSFCEFLQQLRTGKPMAYGASLESFLRRKASDI